MPVDRVVAKIRFTAHEPLRERRLAEITNCMERLLPMNCFGLFVPEAFAFFQSAPTEIERPGWLSHGGVEQVSSEIVGKQCRSEPRSCLLASVRLGLCSLNHLQDGEYRPKTESKKDKNEQNASEAPAIKGRFADDKASPEKKKRGDS